MGLKIIMGKDGAPMSKYWYARFTRNGQKVNVSLKVPIRGTVPLDDAGHVDLERKSDQAFEASRKAALKALEEMERAAKTTGKSDAVKRAEEADMVARYHRARNGKKIAGVPLADLADLWRGLKRSYLPTPERTRLAASTFADFARFAGNLAAKAGNVCTTIDDITDEIATAWFESLTAAYAWGTVKDKWSLLGAAWDRWHVFATKSPFDAVVVRSRELKSAKVPHKPLTEAELARLFELTEDDEHLHSMVVCAACTGMRLGDVCTLTWEAVDLKSGLINVTTAKAGVRVTIPIFDALRTVLENRAARHAVDDSPHVFPDAAARYTHTNADGLPDKRTGLVRMVKPYFARAVFGDATPEDGDAAIDGQERQPLALEEIVARIDSARYTPKKKARLEAIIRQLKAGVTSSEIAAQMSIARGQVSDYLRNLEDLTGETYRPRGSGESAKSARALLKLTRQERETGKNAASLYGWHSLRATFCVLAVGAGVPLADVQKIVGHSADVVTMQYYNPTAEHVAERVRRQMGGTVLETGRALTSPASDTVTVEATAPVTQVTPPALEDRAAKALALARAVIGTDSDEAKTVAAVLAAAKIDAGTAPGRALALIMATLAEDTAKRVRAVLDAAGVS